MLASVIVGEREDGQVRVSSKQKQWNQTGLSLSSVFVTY